MKANTFSLLIHLKANKPVMAKKLAVLATAALLILMPRPSSADERIDFLRALKSSHLQGQLVGCIDEDPSLSSMIGYSATPPAKRPELMRLMAAGLIDIEPLFSYTETNPDGKIRGSIFKTTPTNLAERLRRSDGRVCLGERDIVSVRMFTTPADHDGLKVSSVTYEYRIQQSPNLTESKRLAAVYPELGRHLGTPSETARLVATSEGWVVAGGGLEIVHH